ncbi:Hyaluronidase [Gryllus bimaculatus]|nr:Hyaluronidase [Gryllus bimaculatus]
MTIYICYHYTHTRTRTHTLFRSTSRERVRVQARSRFEAAAKTFMETSLELVSQMRPRAIWGYYAFPYCFNAPLQGCPAQVEQENNKFRRILRRHEDEVGGSNGQGCVGDSVGDSNGGGGGGGIGVVTSGRHRPLTLSPPSLLAEFAGGVGLQLPLTARDSGIPACEALYTSIATPKNMDVNGVVIWGSWNDVKTKAKCEALQSYVGSVLGPIVKNLTDHIQREDIQVVQTLDSQDKLQIPHTVISIQKKDYMLQISEKGLVTTVRLVGATSEGAADELAGGDGLRAPEPGALLSRGDPSPPIGGVLEAGGELAVVTM